MVITLQPSDPAITLLPTLAQTPPVVFRGLSVRCRQITGSIRTDMGEGRILNVKPRQWLCQVEGTGVFFTLDDDLYRVLTIAEEMPTE